MAHTNETAFLKLSQFVGTDIPNPLTDYNSDMEKIDEAVSDISGAQGGYATDIANLQAQNGSETLTTVAQTLSGAVNEIDADTADLASRMTIAEGKIVADESTLATAVTNVSTLAGKVSALETQAGNEVLHTTASTLSGGINELKAEIDGTAGGQAGIADRVTAAESDIAALEAQAGNTPLVTTAQTLSGAINELAQGGQPTIHASDVEFDNTGTHLQSDDVQDVVVELDTEMHSLESTFRDYLGELQTTTLTAGQTTATVNFVNQEIVATSILTPVCSKYGISPTAVTYTSTSMTLTFEAQAEDMIVGARVQNVI